MHKPPDPIRGEGASASRRPAETTIASTANHPEDTRTGHLAEADIRLDSVEAGLARIAIGIETPDTIPAYIKLIQTARWHLKAA